MRKVSISRGATVNLGNYESARIDVTIEDDQGSLADLDAEVKEFLREKIAEVQDAADLPPRPVDRFFG